MNTSYKKYMLEVSVIIPTYGTPTFLTRAIESVLNQTISSWELIIVDDNEPNSQSRKETENIMETFKMDCRITYLKHPKNLNGAVARNTGLKQAKGKYIAFLDSDDEYKKDRLKKCIGKMECAGANVAGVYTGCEFRRGEKIYHTENKIKSGKFLEEALACTFNFCTGSNIFVKRSIINQISGFDEAFLRHQDYEFLVRIFENYSLDAIQEVLVIKNNENTNLPNVERIIEIKKQFITKYKYIINNLPLEKQKYILKSHNIQIIELSLRAGKYNIAKTYFKETKKIEPLKIKELARISALYIKSKIFSN